jgi:hypothetical protein
MPLQLLCPMLKSTIDAPRVRAKSEQIAYFGQCVGPNCSWWDSHYEQCAILTISGNHA